MRLTAKPRFSGCSLRARKERTEPVKLGQGACGWHKAMQPCFDRVTEDPHGDGWNPPWAS